MTFSTLQAKREGYINFLLADAKQAEPCEDSTKKSKKYCKKAKARGACEEAKYRKAMLKFCKKTCKKCVGGIRYSDDQGILSFP